MHITALASGLGGRHLVAGLTRRLPSTSGSSSGTERPTRLTVIGGTSEDITLCGLRLCPDLDALSEILAPTRGGEPTHEVLTHLRSLGVAPEWYPIDDVTFARAIVRSRDLAAGMTPTQICAGLLQADEADAQVALLPMTDQPVETHVIIEDRDEMHAVHVLDWVLRGHAQPAPTRITAAGLAQARPAGGVLDAIRTADVVALPLSAPVTGLGIMLGLPGIRDTLRGTSAPVVGVSPILLPTRGDEAATLRTLDLQFTSKDASGLVSDLLDAYLVPAEEVADLERVASLRGVRVIGVPGEVGSDALADALADAVCSAAAISRRARR